MTESTHELFGTVAKILLRCWMFSFVLLFIWFIAVVSGAVYKLHGPLMGLSKDELVVIHYCGMAFLKVLVLTLFVIPWLSIKLVLKKEKNYQLI